ncbi:hypothetical protein CPTMiller_00115 [Citrobacter phage Miller]|uniref:Uncharacterized protein n=1 Tax=Citrobacter phage Miller TaxID=1527524 RepID=A0A076YPC6_9CAUD|nr:hypothetical protein CPTMiller_00115 [Citrobacter phage Miller]AIK68051.1 hypothetical protein CPTMiller_00115 [Citrobacter phage Miller]QPX73027.1 hypothetical protein [Citrobacter phage vB_Cfr_Xman]
MAYVPKKEVFLNPLLGKSLNHIETMATIVKDNIFKSYTRQRSLSENTRFHKIINKMFTAPVHIQMYLVGEEAYVLVFSQSRNELVGYFHKNNLASIIMLDSNPNFLNTESSGYKESTKVTTRSKMRSLLTNAKRFVYSDKRYINQMLKYLDDVPDHDKSVYKPVVEVTTPSVEEVAPALIRTKFVIEIEADDLERACTSLSSIGVNFMLYNKFN